MFNIFKKKSDSEIVIPELIKKYIKSKIKCKNSFLPRHYAKIADFNKLHEGYCYNAITCESFVSDKAGKW